MSLLDALFRSGVASGVATVNFGTVGSSDASVAVTGQSAILATSAANAWIVAAATADHTADEHVVEEIDVIVGPPTAGVGFTIYARTRNVALRGAFSVKWSWS